jgi:hypothetical protein
VCLAALVSVELIGSTAKGNCGREAAENVPRSPGLRVDASCERCGIKMSGRGDAGVA